MGALFPTSGEDDRDDVAPDDRRPHRIRVFPPETLPKLPPAVDKKQEQARLERDPCKRPVYWKGIDWRRFFGDPRRKHLQNALSVRSQGNTDACSGFAVAAALRANVAIHRNVDVGELNPYFIWALAREKDSQGRHGAGLLPDALSVVNNFGVPDGNAPTYDEAASGSFTRGGPEKYALDWRDPRVASVRKVQAIVDLGCYLGDASAFLHAYGPVVARLMVNPEKFLRVDDKNPRVEYTPGLAYDGEITNQYAGHSVVVVGYNPPEHPEHPDSFIIMNSYGTGWGEKGFAYVPIPTARSCFRAVYGLSLREHYGYTWPGRSTRPNPPNLALFDDHKDPFPGYPPRSPEETC